MPDGYLPLCKLKPIQPFEGAKCIETESLRAIKMDGAQVILAAIGGGQETIPEMERYIMRYKNARPGTYSYRKVQRMKKALPYMQGYGIKLFLSDKTKRKRKWLNVSFVIRIC